MATQLQTGGKFVIDGTINGTAVHSLGGNGSIGLPSTHVVTLIGNSWSGSITVKARPQKPAGWPSSQTWNPAFKAIPYVRRCLGTTAQDDTPVILALTGDFIIKIDSTGLEVALDTTYTSGSAEVYWSVVSGPDA